MNLKKRGLGRGLEALLAETPSKEDADRQPTDLANHQPVISEPQSPTVSEDKILPDSVLLDQSAMAIALVKNIQRENLLLQEEALVLKNLLEEFEQILRRG